jgi:hypothetical protein
MSLREPFVDDLPVFPNGSGDPIGEASDAGVFTSDLSVHCLC